LTSQEAAAEYQALKTKQHIELIKQTEDELNKFKKG